jgi:transcriptional antiterminator Rof (Rho-off)
MFAMQELAVCLFRLMIHAIVQQGNVHQAGVRDTTLDEK